MSLNYGSLYGMNNIQQNELMQVNSLIADGGILPMLHYFWFCSIKIPLSDSWQL